MTQVIQVPESLDSSTALQKLIDKTGNTPAEYVFSPDCKIEIDSLLRFFNYTTVSGGGCTFTLRDNAPPGIFGLQVPLIGAKTLNGVTGLHFKDLKVRGNYKNQAATLKADGADHGKGRHNQIGLGNMSDPQYSCVTNCVFENLDMGYSYGDQIRINGGSNLTFKNITCNLGGHDVLHLSSVKDSEVSGLKAFNLRSNNAVRTRSCTNIDVHDCKVSYGSGYDTGPAFQSESITSGRSSSKIRYHDNVITGLKGAGFYIVADQPADDIQIYNNLIVKCGQMEAAIKRPNVGGATIKGWENAKFYKNTVVDCRGYGVSDTSLKYETSKKGDIEIYQNIFTGMKESYTKGTASGTAIAHLSGSQTTMNAHDNCMWDNARDLYNISQKNGISKDPKFMNPSASDYHLQSSSPCPTWGYSGAQEDPIELIISCNSGQLAEITKQLSNYTVYEGD